MLHTFLPIRSGPDPLQCELPVESRLCVGRGEQRFLFGGAGLATSVAAMEAASGRPAIWATAQYLSYARPGSSLAISCDLPSIGRSITQARATLTTDGREVLTAQAALGAREGWIDQWVSLDGVPTPENCAETEHWSAPDSLGGQFRFRSALGAFSDVPHGPRSDDGRLQFWIRPVDDAIAIDRVILAVIADFVTPGIRNATGRRAGGNSLDNTIRYCRVVPTEWALCDVQIEAIASGIAHGSMRIIAQDGSLLAVASQSMILRVRD
jgi:acyl-CoA thioesterase II